MFFIIGVGINTRTVELSSAMEISVVSPMYLLEDTIQEFVDQVRVELDRLTSSWEIILVDDGSPDDSWSVIERICECDDHVKGIKLSRNFGQQVAISAGMRFAKGSVVIIMDGDLQNPVSAIPLLIKKIEEGNEIVYTVSTVRNHWRDELTSKAFWFVLNRVFKVNAVPDQLMMKAFSARAIKWYNQYNENIRVVAGITQEIGLKSAVIRVENKQRSSGSGNHGFFRRFNLMIDIVIAMTTVPLIYVIYLSLISLLLSFMFGLWTFLNFFAFDVPSGYSSLIVLISFFGSLTVLMLGVIGRYIANIYVEVRQRPLFIVERQLNVRDE